MEPEQATADHLHENEEEQWRAVRQSYDTLAEDYATRIYTELRDKPFERDLLNRFAQLVRSLGCVCDLGCGPGHVARYLCDRGVSVFGVDISAGMVREAKRLNPDILFTRGNMLFLGIGPEKLGGIAALYSIIHLSRNQLRDAFCEMWRVIRPGGYLLIGYHVGLDVVHTTELWGRSVDLKATFFKTSELTDRLLEVGFVIEEAVERDPYPEIEYQSRRGYVLARRPLSSDKLAQA